MAELQAEKDNVPNMFRYPKFEDVTEYYAACLSETVTIPCETLYEKDISEKTVYMCLPGFMNWTPVAIGHSPDFDTFLFAKN